MKVIFTLLLAPLPLLCSAEPYLRGVSRQSVNDPTVSFRDGSSNATINEVNSGPPKVTIRLGDGRQHAGWLTGPQIYDAVYKTLHQACQFQKDRNQVICSPFNKVWSIRKIAYACSTSVCSDASLDLSIPRHYFPPGLDNIEHEFIGQVAGTMAAMVSDEKNCYGKYLNKMRRLFCNVGNFVSVREESREVHLDVAIKFSRNTGEGVFDCVAVKEASHLYFDRDVNPSLSKTLGIAHLDAYVECFNPTLADGAEEDEDVHQD
ncbi:hypothetical protein BS50DRAFT_638774 [Corynespora cassiicola Philippines]|uniref:Uncharacterized protein n=1 Tax=Corynespora cassiicola Philippines TaxID=1448308 RepID=A0A2T2N9X4_CORCC|nr:hypothetical protein BS50DRAFT_638774 [Corynespora cassiicola Philippines]